MPINLRVNRNHRGDLKKEIYDSPLSWAKETRTSDTQETLGVFVTLFWRRIIINMYPYHAFVIPPIPVRKGEKENRDVTWEWLIIVSFEHVSFSFKYFLWSYQAILFFLSSSNCEVLRFVFVTNCRIRSSSRQTFKTSSVVSHDPRYSVVCYLR